VTVMSGLFRATRTADFDRLHQQHAASVYRYAFAVLGNHADAEDVTQQTFLNAYRAIAQGTKPRKAENWLMTITHNEVRRHFRDRQGRALEVELDEQLAEPVPERSEPSLADVLRALEHLTPAQRSALVMREFEGRSYAEIAEIMDVTPSALEALIFRARRALAEQLEEALTCSQAEQALSRSLDGRLPRREARRLKAHLRECPLCVRFADVQKRQRSLLKSLSIMPIPASLFLFRGEQAAAAGLGAGAVGAGGSAAVGGGATAGAAGVTGIAAGLVAKGAAVTAAAAVVGGVGYGVATHPDVVMQPERKVAHAGAVAENGQVRRIAELAVTTARGAKLGPRAQAAKPGRARPHHEPARRKTEKAKAPAATAAPRARTFAKVKKAAAARVARAREKVPILTKTRPTPRSAAKAKPALPRAGARPSVATRIGRTERPTRPKPTKPAPVAEKPSRDAVPPAPPPNAAERGPKNETRAVG
jgi:RNA polymerase sigma factor (sigma-70 family)